MGDRQGPQTPSDVHRPGQKRSRRQVDDLQGSLAGQRWLMVSCVGGAETPNHGATRAPKSLHWEGDVLL